MGRRPDPKTSERKRRTIELARAGYAVPRIAEIVGLHPSCAYAVIRKARAAGEDIPSRGDPGGARFPDAVLAPFEDAAAARGITRPELVLRLIETLAQEPTLVENLLEEA